MLAVVAPAACCEEFLSDPLCHLRPSGKYAAGNPWDQKVLVPNWESGFVFL